MRFQTFWDGSHGRNDRLVTVSVFVGYCAAVYGAAHSDSMLLWPAAAPLGACAGFAAGALATIVLSTYFGKEPVWSTAHAGTIRPA